MAFDIRNLSEVRALGNNRWHWHYFTTDTLATCLAADYFSTVNGLSRLHRGDVLEIVASTAAESQQVTVSSTANGSVTLLQSSAGAATDATARTAAATAQAKADAALPSTAAALGTLLSPPTAAPAAAVRVLMRRLDAVSDYGADSTGVTNSTAALVAFFADCMAGTGVHGFIPPGNYLVTPGQLVISPPSNVDIPGPKIDTIGYYATTFTVDPATAAPGGTPIDAPILKIANLTQTSGAGKFIRAGHLGGISFVDATGHTAPNRCGLSLSGIQFWTFDTMYGSGLRGDLYLVPNRLFSGNPDPYQVALCEFKGVQANGCVGWMFNNSNAQGFNANRITGMLAANGGGLFKSAGAGNTWSGGGVTTHTGYGIWIYDSGATIGKEIIELIEIDDCLNGLRLDSAESVIFDRSRMIHRYHTGIGYYPLTAALIGGSGRSNRYNTLRWVNRLEAPAGGDLNSGGGAPSNADFGTLVDFNSEAQNDHIGIDTYFLSNDGLGGFPTTKYYANVANTQVPVRMRVGGKVILDQFQAPIAIYYSATNQNVAGSGLLGKISFPNIVKDSMSLVSSDEYSVPGPGTVRCSAQLCMTGLTSGQRVRWGFVLDRASSNIYLDQQVKILNANDTGDVSYSSNVLLLVAAGDKIYFGADQNSGVTKALSGASTTAQATCRMSYQYLESTGAY